MKQEEVSFDKKKILNVINIYFSIPFYFGNQFKYLNKKGFDIYIVCSPSNKLKAYSEEQKIAFKEINVLRSFSIKEDFKSFVALYRYIRLEKFDIVIGHTPKGALLSMFASFFAGTKKRIYFRHGIFYETKGRAGRFFYKNVERVLSLLSTQVVCVSPFVLNKSLKDKLTRENKLTLLNIGSCNGVDVKNEFNPSNLSENKKEDLRRKSGLAKAEFVIGYVGRVIKEKGVSELVKAFTKLEMQNENIKLFLVGPFEDRDKLPVETIELIHSNSKITCTGEIDRNKLPYYYSLMDVLVLPTYREGLGTVILEASSMEIPVLVSGHTGSRDAVINETTGEYIEVNQSDIYLKIDNLIKNRGLAKSYGENGRKHMVKNFAQELIWEEIITKIYERSKD